MHKNSAIEVFLRVRPTQNPSSGLKLLPEDQKVEFHVPKDQTQCYSNNKKEEYFKFDKMFGMETRQEQIFANVAQDVIDSAFEGHDGTIFAYGQTGSGKTYTMTGGAERYTDRGILPRTLSYIFHQTRNRADTRYKVCISYIEIYNNEGYDLLDEHHSTKSLSDLSKIIPREREDGTLILSGLSVHKAENEEQALNLLFIGDCNRVVSETPKSDASTHSHCIFIIQIEGEAVGAGGNRSCARIYLVDLSASERVAKTNVDGVLLKEAQYINLSLHHLEQMIVNHDKKSNGRNSRVPYRDSLLNLVLKTSRNSKMRMIVTINAEKDHLDESISTCRFAQQLTLIQDPINPAL